MPRFFARRVTPQTTGLHFAQEEIERARSDARGGWCDRQRSSDERRGKYNWLTNAGAAHFDGRRYLDRNLAARELRRLEIGNTLFNGATDRRRFAHRQRARRL